MTQKDINKYRNKSLSQLKALATKHFNAYIRKRDEGKKCISCESYNLAHASHYYSAGNYSLLKFNEQNVNASCVKCNTFLHGNLIEYRKGIIYRYGSHILQELDILAAQSKRIPFKWDKISLIEIIIKYRAKIKTL